MENDDCELPEISEVDRIKRQLRRRSSIYGSPLVPSKIMFCFYVSNNNGYPANIKLLKKFN